MRVLLGAAVGLLAILLAAMPAWAEMVSLSGQVTYRERIALPTGAHLRIMLVDLSQPGMPARVDVRAPIGSPGQVPLTFALNFDDLAIVREHEHGLVAEIVAGNHLWFRNAEAYRLNPLAPTAPVVIVTSPAERPTGSVAAQDDTRAAEAEGLIGITWRALEIGGTLTVPNVDSTLSIGLDSRVGGRGGCNNYFAQARISGQSIGLGSIAATRMACVSDAANAQETAYFEALAAAHSWRLEADGSLAFLDSSGDTLVRFAAVTR